jgi:hypothetical protein
MPANWTLDDVPRAIGLLDGWLDSMRAPDGYAGPVSHWWDSCLVYTGAMFDWRYEGIVCGYLNLYRTTRDKHWRDKARRAADDLMAGQLPDGHFRNSSFEHGPKSGGTPHESAADIALLEMAKALKEDLDPAWENYFHAAELNIQVLIAALWTGRGFADQPEMAVLVANKNATMLEALLLYQQLGGTIPGAYIESMAETILSAQIVTPGPRYGATIHRGTFGYELSFGIYTARCVGAFARLMQTDALPRYRQFIENAVPYLVSLICARGSWLGHYADGRRIAAPTWIAPSGDLLRALLQARDWVGVPENAIQSLAGVLLHAQTSCGGIPTGLGLASRGALRPYSGLPDFRDILPVVGWCDKAFRALSMIATSTQAGTLAPAEIQCIWRNRLYTYSEDDKTIALRGEHGQVFYEWYKGTSYPTIISLWT